MTQPVPFDGLGDDLEGTGPPAKRCRTNPSTALPHAQLQDACYRISRFGQRTSLGIQSQQSADSIKDGSVIQGRKLTFSLPAVSVLTASALAHCWLVYLTNCQQRICLPWVHSSILVQHKPIPVPAVPSQSSSPISSRKESVEEGRFAVERGFATQRGLK
jgi:hypothetical protein